MIGSYLCEWHWAHWIVKPRMLLPMASMRSNMASMRNCSGSMPPSSLIIELRRNPVATAWSCVAPGNWSPAICSMMNRS